jgi:hypothetical protein
MYDDGHDYETERGGGFLRALLYGLGAVAALVVLLPLGLVLVAVGLPVVLLVAVVAVPIVVVVGAIAIPLLLVALVLGAFGLVVAAIAGVFGLVGWLLKVGVFVLLPLLVLGWLVTKVVAAAR